MGHWSIKIGVSIWCLCSCLVISTVTPIVQIRNGTLEGTFMKSRKGREFTAFRGIPYAQPPLDNLRFEPPKPFVSWTGIRSAKEDANICTQRDVFTHNEEVVGFEDCLYLNVYSPQLPSYEINGSKPNFPVMIYFHGGGWIKGAGHSAFHGPKFLLDHDVVLVTVNYRLGPLGFLSTEDLVSPGNQGLKDQAQSIRWVHENIDAFNGDPNRVTIFGNSAGGASVHYHMISPLSKGLFHRGISQSGTMVCPWALIKPGIAKNQAIKLGKLLDCPTEKSSTLVDCLRKKDVVDVIATDRAFQIYDYCPMIPFGPVIEPDHPGGFLMEEPHDSVVSGKLADVPWMTGITTREGVLKVASIYGLKDQKYDKLLDEKFMKLDPITFQYEHICPKELKPNGTLSLRGSYPAYEPIRESIRWEIIDFYTDVWFVVAAEIAVRHHFEILNSPVYYYFFDYRGNTTFSTVFGDSGKNYGVSHVDELQYLFPVRERRLVNAPLDKEDLKIVELMTGLWVNFAKSGNPTPTKTPIIPIVWKPVTSSKLEYLHIGNSTNLRMTEELFPNRVDFWTKYRQHNHIIVTGGISRTKDEL